MHRVVYTVQGGKLQLSRKVKFRPHCFHECLHTTALFLKSTRSLRASTMDRSAAPPCSTTVSCQSVREEGAGAAMGFQKKPAKYLPRVLTDFTKYAFQPSLVTSDRDRYCKNLFPLWVFPTPWVVPLQSRHEVSGQERRDFPEIVPFRGGGGLDGREEKRSRPGVVETRKGTKNLSASVWLNTFEKRWCGLPSPRSHVSSS